MPWWDWKSQLSPDAGRKFDGGHTAVGFLHNVLGHGHWTLSTSPITTGRQQKISCRKHKDKQRQGQEPQEPEQQWEQWEQWESDLKTTSKKIYAVYHINDLVNIFGIWSGSRHLCWWFKSFKAQRETAGCRSSWKGNHISDAKSPARPVRLGCLNYSEFVPTWYSTHIARKWQYTKMELHNT
jgi:hypothetical protein